MGYDREYDLDAVRQICTAIRSLTFNHYLDVLLIQAVTGADIRVITECCFDGWNARQINNALTNLALQAPAYHSLPEWRDLVIATRGLAESAIEFNSVVSHIDWKSLSRTLNDTAS